MQSYLKWLEDSDYSAVCALCATSILQGPVVRLSCYGESLSVRFRIMIRYVRLDWWYGGTPVCSINGTATMARLYTRLAFSLCTWNSSYGLSKIEFRVSLLGGSVSSPASLVILSVQMCFTGSV